MNSQLNIDLAEFKRDPEAVLQRLSGSDERVGRALRSCAIAWTEHRARVAALRRDKQQIAAAFRDRGIDAEALQSLKARMTAASAALADAELALKRLESDLRGWLECTSGCDQIGMPDVPERFTMSCPLGEAPANLIIERLSATNRRGWDAFVAASRRASIYHYSGWEAWVTGALRQQSMCLLARSGNEILGVLPLYALRSRLFGHFAVSVPYVNYGGPLCMNTGVEAALLEQARRDCQDARLRHMEVRETNARDGWPARNDKVSMVLALPGSTSALEVQLGAKLRSQIRRAGREDVAFRSGADEGLLNDFYAVFARNMRDLGTPVYGKNVFAAVLELWPAQATLLVGYLRRRPVGAALLLRYNDTVEVPWASTVRELNALGLNMQLYWQLLCLAIDSGAAYFDFGRSTVDAGTYRFKKQWGAKPIRHFWHYWLRAGDRLPGLSPESSKFRLLIECWKRLPVPVTKVIGPHIVRCLP